MLAAKLRLSEKQILAATADAVRRRLAPIRGIPTKQGMQRQDADLLEIFDTLARLRLLPAARGCAPPSNRLAQGPRLNRDDPRLPSPLQENLPSKPMEMIREMFGWDEDGKPKPPKSGCS